MRPKYDFTSLKYLFLAAHEDFKKVNRILFKRKLSERCLCGALMYSLNKQLDNKGYTRYYADIEFNRIEDNAKCILIKTEA